MLLFPYEVSYFSTIFISTSSLSINIPLVATLHTANVPTSLVARLVGNGPVKCPTLGTLVRSPRDYVLSRVFKPLEEIGFDYLLESVHLQKDVKYCGPHFTTSETSFVPSTEHIVCLQGDASPYK